MSKPNIILIGAGGHSRACIDVIEQQEQFSIAGLVAIPEEMHIRHFGYSVIATDNDLSHLAKEYQYALIAVGQIQSADNRVRLYKQAVEVGFQLPIIISPTSYVSRHAKIGAGSIVMHGAIINSGAMVGINCIVNSRALIEHDASIEDHCHLSTGAILNGDVEVGSGSFIGSGSIVKEGISLGIGCVVGMDLSVRHNLEDRSRYVSKEKL